MPSGTAGEVHAHQRGYPNWHVDVGCNANFARQCFAPGVDAHERYMASRLSDGRTVREHTEPLACDLGVGDVTRV